MRSIATRYGGAAKSTCAYYGVQLLAFEPFGLQCCFLSCRQHCVMSSYFLLYITLVLIKRKAAVPEANVSFIDYEIMPYGSLVIR